MSEPDRTALFKSEPSAVPPFSLSSSFFGSEVYVDAARNDIDKLLDLFVDQWRELAGETVEREDQVDGGAAVEGAGDGKRKPIKRALFRKSRGTKSGPSIYAVFKTSWVHLGWDKVHISVVSAPLRQEWFRIFSRFFIERLRDDHPNDVRKAGAFLALYTFWASQPASADPLFIRIDPDTLVTLNGLPEALTAIIDGPSNGEAEDESSMLKASDDLFMALHLMHHNAQSTAFFLVPSVYCSHPSLPSSNLVPAVEIAVEPIPTLPTPPVRTTSPPPAKRPRHSSTLPPAPSPIVASTSTSAVPEPFPAWPPTGTSNDMDIDDDATNATAWPPTINGSHEPPPPMEELQLFLRNVGANEARQHLDLGTTNGTNELASHHGADDDWLRDLDSHDQIQAAIAHLQQQTGQP